MKRARAGVVGAVVVAALAIAIPASAGGSRAAERNPVAQHWTAARRAAATPRDLVLDSRGLAYLRRADGSLAPHGHAAGQLFASRAAVAKPVPAAKPGGGGDTAGPVVSNRVPAANATIGTSQQFSATVTDTSGVRSVSVVIVYPNGTQTQSFAASNLGGGTWGVTINGFSAGTWGWRVVAKDTAKPANTTTTPTTSFTVSTGGGGGGGGGTVVNSPWLEPGTIQTAAGRIYFEMPANVQQTRWDGYVCSGTVAEDATSGRSVIITAAHCVYDDAHKAFARNVLFIPDQDRTTGGGTDLTCSNDPLGCWTPSFGVVDNDWASRTFPDNIPWDYAFYVVNDGDPAAHADGFTATGDVLDAAAGDLPVQLSNASIGQTAHALGYSYSDDPNFMYCSEPLGVDAGTDDYWLGSCGLSGGSSGGLWVQPMTGGEGPIISVNSWGYTNQPGMAGPRLGAITACVFGKAKTGAFAPAARGYVEAC